MIPQARELRPQTAPGDIVVFRPTTGLIRIPRRQETVVPLDLGRCAHGGLDEAATMNDHHGRCKVQGAADYMDKGLSSECSRVAAHELPQPYRFNRRER